MTIPKRKNIMHAKRYLFPFAFICMGFLTACSARQKNGVPETESPKANSQNSSVQEVVVSNDLPVEYPFFSSQEDWKLILHEEITETENGQTDHKRAFHLYNEDGVLIQSFSCPFKEGEPSFRFDRLSHYYGYDEDLIVFEENASETGALGFCYPWNKDAQMFSENAIILPPYQEVVSENAFLTTETKDNITTNTICRINEESGQVVKLREWILRGNAQNGMETLLIRDCLTGQELYHGAVKRNELGNLVNDKYYQYLFRDELAHLWNWNEEAEIDTVRVIQDKLETITYQNPENLLADCGFQDKEPFYEYSDAFQRPELVLYFDEETGQGCGIVYGYHYNYDLEEVTYRYGFAFDAVTLAQREPDRTFSTLSVDDEDAREDNVSGYKEIYEYTDDGRLSSFEARGTVVDYGEGGERWEDTLLFMDYVYRDDGTLYSKHYNHHHILFGSTHQSQTSYYDEQGRIIYKDSYITHGSYYYYYIYTDDDSTEPAYCLVLDSGGGHVLPEMISYVN